MTEQIQPPAGYRLATEEDFKGPKPKVTLWYPKWFSTNIPDKWFELENLLESDWAPSFYHYAIPITSPLPRSHIHARGTF